MKKSIAIIGSIIAIFAIILTVSYFKISNEEIRTKNLADAQQEVCKGSFDKMWKILQQQASVTDQYKEAFSEIYPKLMEGRYSNGSGQLMNWIQESNPNFDTSLYGKLMNSIEAQRESFFNEQRKLISINNKHRNLLETAPSSWFVGGRDTLSIVIVKSLKTDKIYETGQEDDINLFN